jgi:hypothetical protein
MRILIALCLFLIWTTPAHAASPPLVIGDSISVASTPNLNAYGIRVDAQVGRQFGYSYWASFGEPYHEIVGGIDEVYALWRAARLPHTVVIALGTNGAITKDQMRLMVGDLTGHRIFFVTCYALPGTPAHAWVGESNRVLWWAHYTYHVPLILWSRVALIDNSDGLGVHPTIAGRAVFARLIAQAL